MARKQLIELTKENIENVKLLGSVCSTKEDIAAWFGVTRQTIYNTFEKYPEFEEAYDEGLGKGRVSLRQSLFKQAKTKPIAAIFLAKNILGMSDKQELTHTGSDGGAIQIERIEHVIIKPKDRNT